MLLWRTIRRSVEAVPRLEALLIHAAKLASNGPPLTQEGAARKAEHSRESCAEQSDGAAKYGQCLARLSSKR